MNTEILFGRPKAKAQSQSNLAKDVKDDKKGLYKYIHDQRKTREKVGLLHNKTGDLVTQDVERVEVLNATFASVFTSKSDSSEIPSLRGPGQSLEQG